MASQPDLHPIEIIVKSVDMIAVGERVSMASAVRVKPAASLQGGTGPMKKVDDAI